MLLPASVDLIIEALLFSGGWAVRVLPGFALVLPNLLRNIVERHDDKATSAAGGVEDSITRIWVKHLDGHLDDVARREELTFHTFQSWSDYCLVGHAFDIYRRSEKVIFLQLGDNISYDIGIETNAFDGIVKKAFILAASDFTSRNRTSTRSFTSC